MKVLVAYASKYGSTKGIAEFIGEKLVADGVPAEVRPVDSAGDLAGYDAFVVGSAVYQFHWLKEAREFVKKNRGVLSSHPVWLFSSGPTGPRPTDKKGRDLREVSAPKETGELRGSLSPRDHRVFFGAFYADRLTGTSRLFARMVPKEDQGDFRNWNEIKEWSDLIAAELHKFL
jgi:menaquinone-dependent protoporphyrinogen oxidase